MVVAGVVLKPQSASALTRRGVVDSKSFGAGEDARRERSELALHIRRLAADVQVEVFDHGEVDRFAEQGLLNELERRAAKAIIDRCPSVKRIVADGVKVFGLLRHRYPHLEAHDFGETYHVAVAAASIVAKVLRDRLMRRIAARFPEYGFERNMGYPTPEHREALARMGPCLHHRLTFFPVRDSLQLELGWPA